MTITATIRITCDICTHEIQFDLPGVDFFRVSELIKNHGWILNDEGQHFCVECQNKDASIKYPPDIVELANYRLWVIQPLVEMDKKQRTHAIIEERVREVREHRKQAEEAGQNLPGRSVGAIPKIE